MLLSWGGAPIVADGQGCLHTCIAQNHRMDRLYLNVPFQEKDAAKALGARFDRDLKLWYAQSAGEAMTFSKWLPAGIGADALVVPPAPLERPYSGSSEVQVASKGVSLSRLLNGVAKAVAEAYASGVWTLVEVLRASSQKGHVYLEVTERDGSGQVLAKANAVIWANTASRILPEFEKATGAIVGDGIKLLVRARPVFKAQYGFTLEIDAIDPAYTLGDLEAKKKEIRDRLHRDGVFNLNRQLPPPWDFRTVLVVAPQGAAGLGDFQKESDRLAHFGLCQFTYVHSRFQGEGAAGEILAAMQGFLTGPGRDKALDAVVIIRGGGAVNDLAWLNDYNLARFVCEHPVPVIVGIGHERDKTMLDEVAHQAFDTPSKTIAGIEQAISRRAGLAKAAADTVFALATARILEADRQIERLQSQTRAYAQHQTGHANQVIEQGMGEIRLDTARLVANGARSSLALLSDITTEAQHHLGHARRATDQDMGDIHLNTARLVGEGARSSLAWFNQVRHDSMQQVAQARQQVPGLFDYVRTHVLGVVADARTYTAVSLNTVVDRTMAQSSRASIQVDAELSRIAERAQGSITSALTKTEGLMREVTGQGPDKTLKRGFAVVRTNDGKPVTRIEHVADTQRLQIEFSNGIVNARADNKQDRETT